MVHRFVTVAQFAAQVHCSEQTVRRLLRAGDVPGIKLGHDWRVDQEGAIIRLSNHRSHHSR